jgi:hypothetical protein
MAMGDFVPGAVLDLAFTTRVGGVPTTLAGTPVVSVYKDNSTTQTTAGVTLTVDFDGVTGLNHVRIDTSADATFYAAGSSFMVVITTGTVGGVSVVGVVVDDFSLGRAATTVLDLADSIETGLTVRQALRLMGAVLGGKCSGAATNTPAYRNAVADSKTRVSATTDNSGDRTAITTDLT